MFSTEIAQFLKTLLTTHVKNEQESFEGPPSVRQAVLHRRGTKGYYSFSWQTATGEKCISGTGKALPRRISKLLKRHHAGGGLPCLSKISMSNATIGAEWKVVLSSDVRKLTSLCPRLREVSFDGFSFGAAHRKRRVKLRDFPQGMVSLSLRGCVLDMKTFFSAGPTEHGELTTLDLGRCFFLNDDKACSGRRPSWPSLPALERLCLEGCPFLISDALLSDVLLCCPALQVLDLEGTLLQRSVDLAMIGKCLPKLRELFVGWTDVNDSTFLALQRGSFDSLSTLCLAGTAVTNLGVLAVCGVCPLLRVVRVNMGRCAVRRLENVDACTSVSFEVACFRSDNVHAVLRHEGCEHFRQRV
ncbi:hypothetical protein V5799_006224 [Amblyomma americanum]|uniref:Uncharacterized protein n=1 Tax=Amblyomma americanum TaxID=6943 RepID=A0AAQ4DX03_AMBAM